MVGSRVHWRGVLRPEDAVLAVDAGCIAKAVNGLHVAERKGSMSSCSMSSSSLSDSRIVAVFTASRRSLHEHALRCRARRHAWTCSARLAVVMARTLQLQYIHFDRSPHAWHVRVVYRSLSAIAPHVECMCAKQVLQLCRPDVLTGMVLPRHPV